MSYPNGAAPASMRLLLAPCTRVLDLAPQPGEQWHRVISGEPVRLPHPPDRPQPLHHCQATVPDGIQCRQKVLLEHPLSAGTKRRRRKLLAGEVEVADTNN